MLQFIGQPGIPLFLSDSSSERPFPWEYRQYSMMVNLLPILNPQPPVQQLFELTRMHHVFEIVIPTEKRVNGSVAVHDIPTHSVRPK